MSYGDTPIYTSSSAAPLLNRGDYTVGLELHEFTPSSGGFRRCPWRWWFIHDHYREQAKAVQLAERPADSLQSCIIYTAHISNFDEAYVDIFFGDFGDKKGAGRRWQLG